MIIVAKLGRRLDEARLPAVVFLVGYAFLLLCIPSQLIVKPLGAPGTPANLWGLGALLWWMCATLGGQNRGHRSPIRWAMLALTTSLLLSYAAGMLNGWFAPVEVHEATGDIFDYVPATVESLSTAMISAADRGLLTFGGWLGIVLLTADGLRSWGDVERLVKWMVWFGAFVATLGIIQFFTGLDIASFFRIPGLVANSDFGAVDSRSILRRVSGTAVHPIEFGVVMAALLSFALHRLIYVRGSRWTWVPVALIGVALPLSVSRSAILAGGVIIIVLFSGWSGRIRRRALIIIPFAVVAVRVMVPGLVGTITSLFANVFVDPSITGRTDDYTVVFNLYNDHPLLGRGLFTFIPRYYRILDNQYLGNLLELGIVGLVTVIGVYLTGIFLARGARRRTRNTRNRHLALAISASLSGVVLSFVTFDAWSFPMAAGLTFLLLGMAGAVWRIADSSALARQQRSTNPNESEIPVNAHV